jgi:putative membrane protein
MILPGLSGSFILLLMGKYEFILGSLKSFNIGVIVTFAAGCVVGLISFSHLLTYLFQKFRGATVAVLAGFMIGSLNKVWPWKETISYRINSKGEEVPFLQNNVFPNAYTEITGEANQLVLALVFAILGFALIVVMDFAANRKLKTTEN